MIALMDCNNFFVSCERIFRPDLERRPVAVLSSNDGCIVSRSKEVKELGVSMGAPYFEVQELCRKEGVTLFSSNFKLYRDISDRVMRILEEEVGQCEMYSIDEAFFEINDNVTRERLFLLRKTIFFKTGIPVSIGVGKTKTLAKIGGDYAKKGNGVYILDDKIWKAQASSIPCGAVWGIGGKTAKKMNTKKIFTVSDILDRGLYFMREHFGVVGERLYHELSGIPTDLRDHSSVRQSLASTRSFHTVVHDKSILESAIGYHVAHIGEKLRSRKLLATHIKVIAAPGRYSDFAHRKGSLDTELREPTNNTEVLLKESLKLLTQIFSAEVPYKKAGFVVAGIMPKSFKTKSFFSEDTGSDDGTLYEIADILNHKFGAGTLRPGIILETEKWKSNARLKSPEYTTNWKDIRIVKAM